MPSKYPLNVERMLEKIDIGHEEACWEWLASISTGGYGKVDSHRLAHREMYRLVKGEVPEGLFVRHTCDNRKCCNPKHLLVGTKAQNSQDMVDRKRSTYGMDNPQAKLCESDVIEIRRLAACREITQPAMARRFDVCLGTIEGVVARKSWRHIP